MFVTIAICTWNRSRLLDCTLAGMTKLIIPRNVQWELVIVNNRCTDDTDQTIARYDTLLPIQRLYEEKPGKSNAANLAIAKASGDLILWTDDDVLVDPAWLENYVRAAEIYPEADFFGGRILPWFESKPPRWVVRHMERISGCFAQRLVPFSVGDRITASYLPYGANFAMRRGCLGQCPFNPKIGPLEKTEIRGEDEALIENLLETGFQGAWVPDAVVSHFIPRERLTTRYIWNFYRGFGQSLIRRKKLTIDPGSGSHLFGYPRWMIRWYLETYLVSCLLSPFKNSLWCHYFTRAAIRRGIMNEAKVNNLGNGRELSGLGMH